ncbi:hypothetical protein [Paucihalobacter sp.]|uniref:hypothetical protein n=1 Tax=Paucihalobacter sp. TaxID=2850405 RepID=UPI002FE04948
MSKLKLHITFKGLAILLVCAVLSPYVVKLSHSFNHHTHQVCNGFSDTHFHSLDLDCEFYKFQIQKDQIFDVVVYSEYKLSTITNYQSILYFFSYEHQHLSFSLRAPPALV